MRYILVLLAASFAWGQTTETTITDTVRIPVNGGLFNGKVVVTPSHRMTCGSNSYALVPPTVQIVNGALSLSLVPNSACTPVDSLGNPATYYTAKFSDTAWGGGGWTETWIVPVSATAVTLASVRAAAPAAATVSVSLAQLLSGGATVGQGLVYGGSTWAPGLLPQSQVDGLVVALSGKADTPHDHNASTDLATGTVPVNRGGTGADNSAATGVQQFSTGTGFVAPLANWNLPGDFNISDHTTTKPVKSGTSLPATCSVDEFFNKNDEPAGTGLFSCTAANVWTRIVGSGGGGSVTTYEVTSFIASFTLQTSVSLAHNFGTLKQQLYCRDATGKFVEPKDFTPGSASSVVTFSNAQTGECVLIGGTGLYEESFTGQTSINLDHDFNTTAIAIQCYDGAGKWVEWKDATATDANNATVTFTTPQDGRCGVVSTLATGGGGGSGTVTLVGVSGITGVLSVTNSPVTTSGTMALSLDSQTAYKFLGTGAATGVPSFQTIPAAALAVMTGDSGAGGVKGAVPAPAAGDAAAGKYLKADGTWAVPAGGGGGDATLLQATETLSSWGAITAAGTSGSCVRKNIILTGVVGGDVVKVGPPPTIETGLTWQGLAGTDIAIVQLCNNTGASITPADGGTYRVQVVRSAI